MDYEKIILDYYNDLSQLSNALEEVKKNKFQDLMRQLFPNANQEIGEYTQNLEKKVKISNSKGMLTSGRIDAYFGDLVIEFERDIPKKLDDGSFQIKQYCAGLWNQEEKENRKPYIGIVTDGLHWYVYYPDFDLEKDFFAPEDITLKEKDKFYLEGSESSAKYFFYFINNLFFREGKIDPTIENIKKDFGVESFLYENIYTNLKQAFDSIKNNPEINLSYIQWHKYLTYTYGDLKTTEDLYLRHTYLSVLARFIVWAALAHKDTNATPSLQLINDLISGKWFKDIGVINLVESDFFHWITHEEIIKKIETNWFMVLNVLVIT